MIANAATKSPFLLTHRFCFNGFAAFIWTKGISVGHRILIRHLYNNKSMLIKLGTVGRAKEILCRLKYLVKEYVCFDGWNRIFRQNNQLVRPGEHICIQEDGDVRFYAPIAETNVRNRAWPSINLEISTNHCHCRRRHKHLKKYNQMLPHQASLSQPIIIRNLICRKTLWAAG